MKLELYEEWIELTIFKAIVNFPTDKKFEFESGPHVSHEDGGSMFLLNISDLPQNCMVAQPG
jgi:hypothetical protein